MPRLGFDGSTPRLARCSRGTPKEKTFDDHNADEHGEGKWRWWVVRREDVAHGRDRDPDRGANEHQPNSGRGKRFGLAVAIRMIVVGSPARQAQPAPDNE